MHHNGTREQAQANGRPPKDHRGMSNGNGPVPPSANRKSHRHEDEEQGKLFVGGLRYILGTLLLGCLFLRFISSKKKLQLGHVSGHPVKVLFPFWRGD